VVHRHIRTEISYAHGDLPEPLDEFPQRFSLFLADADHGDERQVMGLTGSELDVELSHQRLEIVNRIRRGLREPAQRTSFRRSGKDPT